MANNIQELLNALKPTDEEEQLFSPMNPTSEQLASIKEQQQVPELETPVPVQPVMKQPSPKKDQSSTNPFMEGIDFDSAMAKLPKKDANSNQDTDSTSPETPLSAKEKLMQEYLQLSGKDNEELKQARERDRMLKIGGSIGDALATYLNAQSQMRVKAPGVQVQQGAGLGKVADLFATAPEIESDVKARRQALMDQYKQMISGESKEADRRLKERQIAAYEAQTRAQARKTEADTAKESRKEEQKLSVGEETLDREFAKKYNNWTTQGKADYEENSKILNSAISDLKSGKVETGTLAGAGSRVPGVRTNTRELETRVRKALNGMLRSTLGAQFTQEEGERIFQQTFDPFADPNENVKNMQTELSKLEKQKQLIEDQGKVFKQKGTLRNYEIPKSLEEKNKDNKTLVDKQHNKKLNKTRLIYSDGTVEEVDGLK